MIYNVRIEDREYQLEVVEGGKTLEVRLNGRSVKLENFTTSAGRPTMLLKDNRPFEIVISKENSAYECWLASRSVRCEIVSEKEARYAQLAGNNVAASKIHTLRAPMPGLVVRVEVEIGQQVKKGDGLLVVEAMKMENELKASYPGTIKEIKISVGQPVEKNQILVVFE